MSMSVVEMEKNLKLLRLHGMHATLQTRGLQASQGGSFMEVPPPINHGPAHRRKTDPPGR